MKIVRRSITWVALLVVADSEAEVSLADFPAAADRAADSPAAVAALADFPVAEGPQAGRALLWEAAFITADPVAGSFKGCYWAIF